MIDFIPDPVAFQIGPFPVYWYGIGYARRPGRGLPGPRPPGAAGRRGPEIVGNGMIIVAIAALIGGRLYHVIDQWALYQDDPIKVILPPVFRAWASYGGIVDRDHRRPFAVRPHQARAVLALGGHRRARPVRDAGASRAGGTSSTRSCTGRRRRCRGASRSTAPIGSSSTPVRASSIRPRPAGTSTRCSCTSRCRGFVGACS